MTHNIYSASYKELQNFIDKYFTSEIYQHYYDEAGLANQRHLEALGKSFYKLACMIKACLMLNDDEEMIVSTYSFFYHSLLDQLSLNNQQFLNSKEILLEPEVNPKNDNSDTLKFKMFFVLLAKSSEHHFISLITSLISLLPEINEVALKRLQSKSESILCDSYTHKEKGENIWRNRKKYNSLHSFFNIGKYRIDYQSFFNPKSRWQLTRTWEIHKSLSIIGAFYIEYILHFTIFETSKNKTSISPSSLIFASQAVSNTVLISMLENDLIDKNDLIATIDIDSTSTEYQVQCIHSLFAIGFLESLYRNKRREPYESKATDWLIKRIDNALCDRAFLLNNMLTSYIYNFNKPKYADMGINKYLYIANKSNSLSTNFSHYKDNNAQRIHSKSNNRDHKLKSINNEVISREGANKTLFQLKETYGNMTVNSLENIWKKRNSEFNFIEEAAIALSFIRYLKGIDSSLINYQKLCNQEMILELDLPSIFEGIDEANSEKVSLQPNQELCHPSQSISEKETLTDIEWKERLQHSSLKTSQREQFAPILKDERFFVTATIAYRVGQSNFRAKLIEKWGCCNITGCRTVAALDAAHIIPYRGEKDNDIRNGLLLRADIHRLFDAYQIGIEPESLKIYVSPLIDDPMYQAYHGKKLNIGSSSQISIAALKHHWSEFVAKNNIT